MKVRELKAYLSELAEELNEAEIVTSGSDHSYCKSPVQFMDAERAKDGSYYEYWDDANMSKGSKKTKVLLVG